MARRVLLVTGVLLVALLAAVVALLAMSGDEKQVARPDGLALTATAFEPTLRTYYNATLTALALALIDHATQMAAYDGTVSANTQQASQGQTATAEMIATAQAATVTRAAALDQTQTQHAALALTLRGTLRAADQSPLPGVGIRLYRDDGDGRFSPFAPDAFLTMVTTGAGGEYDFGVLEPGVYWLELAYYSLPAALQAALAPDEALMVQAAVPVTEPMVFEVESPFSTPSSTPTLTPVPSFTPTRTPTLTPAPSPAATDISSTATPTAESTPSAFPATRSGSATPSASARPVVTLPALITLTSTPEPGAAQVPATQTPTPEMIP